MLWRLLIRSMRPYRGLILAVVLFQLAQAVANLILPNLNATIVDRGVVVGDTARIWHESRIMLAISFGQVACSIAAVYAGAALAMRIGRDLRASVFATVGSFSENEVQRFGAPSLITRTTNDIQQVQMLVLVSATLMVAAPFVAVGGVIMALHQDVGLAWIMVVAIPVLLLAIGLIVTRMVPHFRRMQKRIDAINGVMREQLSGIRVVRAFVREDVERRRFGTANADVTESALRAGRLMAAIFPVVMAVMNLSSVAVLWLGADRIDAGDLKVGALQAFLMYLMLILMSVLMAVFMFIMVPRAAVAADRIGEVLFTTTSVTPPRDGVQIPAGPVAVEFRDVTFAYPGAEFPVLSRVNFTAQPGTTTAIVGSTGAGKTTLVNLIPRLFDASEGAVLVGGVDVKEADLDSLWGRIGLVPQRAYLFSGTIASNLRFGQPDAGDDEMWEALGIAQARDFVSAMPGALEAEIAQGGTTVSGGQRQRLSIARALVRQPDILIVDDALSALDTATDARVRRGLRKAAAGATVIVVAQRVSSIMDADQIFVLENGVVVAAGTHAELIETSDTYREIVESQLRPEEVA